ncbi:MAG: GGDEF domain-containing protein [Candidatus Omnitrophica bacterium]|nr:GGDEF domain-containing protein [Candidatus Omnitrophota bacterium]
MAAQNSIRNRLILLMVGFSVFFIVAFTSIQLKNTMTSISTYNTFRAKLGAFITHNALAGLRPTIDAGGVDVVRLIDETLQQFVMSEILEKVTVLGPNSMVSMSDRRHLEVVREGGKDEWLYYFIDSEQKQINIFISFLPTNDYVVKLTYSLGNIGAALRQIYNPIITTVIVIIGANIVLAVILSWIIVNPLRKLHRFTKIVADGNLASRVFIKTNDEFQDLSESFNTMTIALQKMKDRAENANPLTKLPGNLVIMEEVERRIQGDSKFVVLYTDLNNFKAFNDKYGIHQGDKAIKMTADILKDVVREKGNADDLVGHEGGDDFVVVTTPDRAAGVAETVISEFDKRVKALYNAEDIEHGYFVSHNRSGETQKFPIMGIALSGATNQHRAIASYGEVTNICAEVKKKTKAQGVSAYAIDARCTERKA